MLLHISRGTSIDECINKENEFLKSLKFGQWYSTQVNPIVHQTTNTETKDGDNIKMTVNKYVYEFVVMTYYLEESELNQSKKLASNPFSG